MLTQAQIREILIEVAMCPDGGSVCPTDREISLNMDDIRPYVKNYKRYLRHFTHEGLSAKGHKFLADC